MKQIPFLLIYFRFLLAIVIPFLAFFQPRYYASIIAVFLITGILTDIFDGIIARKLNISTRKLRVLDSNVDQFFWIIAIISIFYVELDVIKPVVFQIGVLIILEAVAYLASYIKFKKPIATHSLLAKFWTLTLLAFLIDLILNAENRLFQLCFWIGVVSRLEIILIILKLKKWTTDVPSIFSVSKLNKGLTVKKNKIFNG